MRLHFLLRVSKVNSVYLPFGRRVEENITNEEIN